MCEDPRAIKFANLEKDALIKLLLSRDDEIEKLKRTNEGLEVCRRLNKAYESLEVIIDMREKSKEQIRRELFGVPADTPEADKLKKIHDFENRLLKTYDTFEECKESGLIVAFWAYPDEETNKYKALWDDCVRMELKKKRKSLFTKAFRFTSKLLGCGPERKLMTVHEISREINAVAKDARAGATDEGTITAKVADASKGTPVKLADKSGGAAGGSSGGVEPIASGSKSLLEEINSTRGQYVAPTIPTSNASLAHIITPPGLAVQNQNNNFNTDSSIINLFPPPANSEDLESETDV